MGKKYLYINSRTCVQIKGAQTGMNSANTTESGTVGFKYRASKDAQLKDVTSMTLENCVFGTGTVVSIGADGVISGPRYGILQVRVNGDLIQTGVTALKVDPTATETLPFTFIVPARDTFQPNERLNIPTDKHSDMFTVKFSKVYHEINTLEFRFFSVKKNFDTTTEGGSPTILPDADAVTPILTVQSTIPDSDIDLYTHHHDLVLSFQ